MSTSDIWAETITKDYSDLEAERYQIDTRGLEQYYKLQNGWSWVAGTLLFTMVIAQIAILALVGGGRLNFKEYGVTLNMFMGQSFLQIVGIAYIIVKFLFPQLPETQKKQPSQNP